MASMNPVLPILYSRCPEYGLLPVAMQTINGPVPLPAGSWFHLHWTRFVQAPRAGAPLTFAEARTRSGALVDSLRQMKASGTHIAWTIHEPLPHDCQYPEVEIDLRQELADVASVIHVLHDSTLEEVAPYYRVDPGKVLMVEHPLYRGVYTDYVTKASARRLLNVVDDEFLVLIFGSIRPYKGIDRMLEGVDQLHRQNPERKLRVLIAGPSFESVDNTKLIEQARSTPGVSIMPTLVHPSHVQLLFRSADLVLLPYRDFLNSGVLMLALSFERPVLAAENPVTRDAMSSGLVRLFARSDDNALVEALQAAVCSPELLPQGPLHPDFARRHDPVAVAGRFAAGMAQRSSRPG